MFGCVRDKGCRRGRRPSLEWALVIALKILRNPSSLAATEIGRRLVKFEPTRRTNVKLTHAAESNVKCRQINVCKAPDPSARKLGTIAFNGGGGITCRIRDISEGGARLEVASQFGIPNEFKLVIGTDNWQRQCRVAWRKANRLGVAFD